jgi:hypothetical protein
MYTESIIHVKVPLQPDVGLSVSRSAKDSRIIITIIMSVNAAIKATIKATITNRLNSENYRAG